MIKFASTPTVIRSKACFVLLVIAFACSSLLAKDQAPPPEVLAAKTVYVMARIGNVGAGKNKPDDRRAKSQVTKELQKWGRYQVVDDLDKADVVLIVTEGHTGTYGSTFSLPGGNLGSGGGSGNPVNTAAPDVLSDTLAVYKAGAVNESAAPLWKATESGDDWDWPAERVVKKFRKAVEKASK